MSMFVDKSATYVDVAYLKYSIDHSRMELEARLFRIPVLQVERRGLGLDIRNNLCFLLFGFWDVLVLFSRL